MRFKLSFKEKDLGKNQLFKILEELRRNPLSVDVGVLDEGKGAEVRDGGLTNAQIAIIHEFGAPAANIPERSFMRSTYHEQRARLIKSSKTYAKMIIEGKMTQKEALDELGAFLAGAMVKKIMSGEGVPPPNAPSTMMRKIAARRRGKRSMADIRTLVDTGRMVRAITWRVVPSKKK